jgi:hypothetical protein
VTKRPIRAFLLSERRGAPLSILEEISERKRPMKTDY